MFLSFFLCSFKYFTSVVTFEMVTVKNLSNLSLFAQADCLFVMQGKHLIEVLEKERDIFTLFNSVGLVLELRS